MFGNIATIPFQTRITLELDITTKCSDWSTKKAISLTGIRELNVNAEDSQTPFYSFELDFAIGDPISIKFVLYR